MSTKTIALIGGLIAAGIGGYFIYKAYKKTESAEISLSQGNASPLALSPGDNINVEVKVKNTGGTSGTWAIIPSFQDGLGYFALQRKTVTLEPGEERVLSWQEPVPNKPGTGRLVIYYEPPYENNYKVFDVWITIS